MFSAETRRGQSAEGTKKTKGGGSRIPHIRVVICIETGGELPKEEQHAEEDVSSGSSNGRRENFDKKVPVNEEREPKKKGAWR